MIHDNNSYATGATGWNGKSQTSKLTCGLCVEDGCAKSELEISCIDLLLMRRSPIILDKCYMDRQIDSIVMEPTYQC